MKPSVTTVEFPGVVDKFDAISVSVGILTPTTHYRPGEFSAGYAIGGVPQISVEVVVNAHDTENLPYSSLLELFNLAQNTSHDQIGDVKLTFWKDESHSDVVCTLTFKGWINNFQFQSGGDGNHTAVLHIVPGWTEGARPMLSISN